MVCVGVIVGVCGVVCVCMWLCMSVGRMCVYVCEYVCGIICGVWCVYVCVVCVVCMCVSVWGYGNVFYHRILTPQILRAFILECFQQPDICPGASRSLIVPSTQLRQT